MTKVQPSSSPSSNPPPFQMILRMAMEVLKQPCIRMGRVNRPRNGDNGCVLSFGKVSQHANVPPQQGSRFESRNSIVAVHGQQPINHDQGCSCDGEFMRQTFDLAIELVKGEPSTQVQSLQAGFNISSQCLQTGDETSGVDSTCSVHPVDHFPLRQCVRDPMFSNTPHALAFASRPGQLVELTAYRLKGLRINLPSSLNQARIGAQRWLFFHVNH